MNIIALDTSTDACSVALAIGREVVADHRITPRRQAQLVLPMIDDLLAKSGLSRTDLDGIVFGQGPGSFTGLRVAASVTQGIALGLDIGVIGISSLAAMAQGCHRRFGDRYIAVALDARLDEVYWGAYRVPDEGAGDARAHAGEQASEHASEPGDEHGFERGFGGVVVACVDERVCRPDAVRVDDDIEQRVGSCVEPGVDPGLDPGADPGIGQGSDPDCDPDCDPGCAPGSDPGSDPGLYRGSASGTGDWTLAGSGAERYEEIVSTTLGLATPRLRPGIVPHARDLLTLAAARIARGEFLPAEAAVPVYLRERVAQTEAERGVVPPRSPSLP